MAKSQESFNKKEKEKKRLKKRQDKQQKKEDRKSNPKSSGFDDMIAYVDEYGNITDTPPDPTKKVKIDASSIEIGVPRREKEEEPANREGIVSFFNDGKGFGFIVDGKSQEKFFFHVSGLIDEVSENDRVTFELERGAKGMNAVNVKKK